VLFEPLLISTVWTRTRLTKENFIARYNISILNENRAKPYFNEK